MCLKLERECELTTVKSQLTRDSLDILKKVCNSLIHIISDFNFRDYLSTKSIFTIERATSRWFRRMGPFCGLISNLLIDLSYPMLCGKLPLSIPSLACCPLLPLSVQVCLATSIYQSIINAAIVASTEAEAATWSTMLLPPCARLLP